jgi:hypothetical protein
MKHSFRTITMALAVAVLAMLGCVAHAYGQTAYAYPFSTNYGTGWVTHLTKQDDTVKWFNTPLTTPRYGWSDFDLTALPESARWYGTVKLHYDQIRSSATDAVYLYWCGLANPLIQTAGDLFDSLATGFCLNQQGAEPGSVGWHVITLPSWSYWPAIIGDSLVISWQESSSNDSGAAYGRREANKPYLEFIH